MRWARRSTITYQSRLVANIKNEKLRSQHELVLQAPHNHEYAKKILYNMGHKTQDRM